MRRFTLIRIFVAAISTLGMTSLAPADDLGSIDTGAGRNIDSGGVGGARGAGEAGRDRRAFDRAPSNQEQVEREMERGTGRIVDQQTWELDQLDRQHDDRTERPFDVLERDLDRQDRIDNALWRAKLEQRLDALMRVDEPRRSVMLSDSATSPILGTPLLRWIIETSEFVQTTRPTTQPESSR